jgi:hypothetical protein
LKYQKTDTFDYVDYNLLNELNKQDDLKSKLLKKTESLSKSISLLSIISGDIEQEEPIELISSAASSISNIESNKLKEIDDTNTNSYINNNQDYKRKLENLKTSVDKMIFKQSYREMESLQQKLESILTPNSSSSIKTITIGSLSTVIPSFPPAPSINLNENYAEPFDRLNKYNNNDNNNCNLNRIMVINRRRFNNLTSLPNTPSHKQELSIGMDSLNHNNLNLNDNISISVPSTPNLKRKSFKSKIINKVSPPTLAQSKSLKIIKPSIFNRLFGKKSSFKTSNKLNTSINHNNNKYFNNINYGDSNITHSVPNNNELIMSPYKHNDVIENRLYFNRSSLSDDSISSCELIKTKNDDSVKNNLCDGKNAFSSSSGYESMNNRDSNSNISSSGSSSSYSYTDIEFNSSASDKNFQVKYLLLD